MSLDESVDLVEYAFTNAQESDLFVRKAPASTIEDLAHAVAQILSKPPQLQVIGGRHGEKLYESLLSVEEMSKAEDHGEYYRVPLDARSLDYGLYTEEGSIGIDRGQDYNSHNTQRLGVDEVVALLETLPEFRMALRDACRTGDLPDLSAPFTRDLFNTYRAYTFPEGWPILTLSVGISVGIYTRW